MYCALENACMFYLINLVLMALSEGKICGAKSVPAKATTKHES